MFFYLVHNVSYPEYQHLHGIIKKKILVTQLLHAKFSILYNTAVVGLNAPGRRRLIKHLNVRPTMCGNLPT